MKQRKNIKKTARKILRFLLNPRLLLCIGIAWLITNGWSYILLGIGTYWQIGWMIAVSTAYLAFLWFPASPEKVATALIAMALLRVLFPGDEKTLGVLRELYAKIKGNNSKRNETTEPQESDEDAGR